MRFPYPMCWFQRITILDKQHSAVYATYCRCDAMDLIYIVIQAQTETPTCAHVHTRNHQHTCPHAGSSMSFPPVLHTQLVLLCLSGARESGQHAFGPTSSTSSHLFVPIPEDTEHTYSRRREQEYPTEDLVRGLDGHSTLVPVGSGQ